MNFLRKIFWDNPIGYGLCLVAAILVGAGTAMLVSDLLVDLWAK